MKIVGGPFIVSKEKQAVRISPLRVSHISLLTFEGWLLGGRAFHSQRHMGDIGFLRDLGVVVAAAAIGGWTARRLGLSVVVGYLIAGILVSPHLAGAKFVSNPEGIGQLAQIGLVFLMFGIGLQLSLKRLRQLGVGLVVATAVAALLVFNLGRAGGMLVGLEASAAAFLAAAIMSSSSAIISKVVQDTGVSHQRPGQEALGMTVLEDIVAVVMLSLLATTAGAGGEEVPSVGATLGWLSVFVVGAVIAGLLILPKLFGRVDASGDEVRTLLVAALVILLAVGSVQAGYSLALGAFLLGLVVAETSQSRAVEAGFAGMRDLFSAVFFVAMGMMLDLKLLTDAWVWAVGLAFGSILVRVLSVGLGLTLVGHRPSEAARTALLVTPLGEFSFLIVQLGIAKAVLPEALFPAAVGASVITSLAAPWLASHGERVASFLRPVDLRRFGRFIGSYHALLARITGAAGKNWLWKPVRSRLSWAVGEVIVTVAILASAGTVSEIFAPELQGILGLAADTTRLVAWSALAVAAAVPLLAAWRNLSTVSLFVAEYACRGLTRRKVFEPLLDGGLRLAAALLIFNILSSVIPWEEAGGWAAPAAIAAGIVAALIFGRRLLKLHNEAESALRLQFGESVPEMPDWAKPADTWPLQLIEVEIDHTSVWRGLPLSETGIRRDTGCSVVQIDRAGVCLLNPGPTERLFPGDKVLLAGEGESLAKARLRLCESGAARDTSITETSLRTVTIPSPFDVGGATLAELDLARHTGVQVLGLRRGREKLAPVPAGERVLPGDELLILATSGQERELTKWLRERRARG
jgi:CPA2 family monovalent cation:H+ antiporter-2